MTTRSLLRPAMALLLLVLCAGTAFAQTGDSTLPAGNEWQFLITPYWWNSGIKGDIIATVEPEEGVYQQVTIPVDIGFTDMGEALKYGLSLHAEVSKGAWGGILDINYAKYAEGTETRLSYDPEVWVKSGMDLMTVDLLGSYRLQKSLNNSMIEALVGLRYSQWTPDLLFTVDGDEQQETESSSWVDPLVGMRFATNFAGEFYGSARIEIGGFGVGSDFTWGLHGIVGYRLTKMIDLDLGYRYISLDWQSEAAGVGGRGLTVVQSGLLLGVGFRF